MDRTDGKKTADGDSNPVRAALERVIDPVVSLEFEADGWTIAAVHRPETRARPSAR